MLGEFQLLDPHTLHPHEQIDARRLARLVEELRAAGVFYPPVLVDRESLVILDGHHRWHAASRLGLVRLPCYVVAYLDNPGVRVMSRRPGIEVSKQSVLEMARTGSVYPHKTTRHMYDLPEWIEPVPLDRLMHA
ncbi:MAG TPA: ParB N-terminal domain-containing protein [Candidatus Krumholzibacteria bacterium]|nr:ParB N-terminal domain-containing protein [Candidatus Krumholzibacteria bacterium]